MTPTKFEELFHMVAPSLTKELQSRDTIIAEEKLCVTLGHVVTGFTHTIISLNYRVSPTTVGKVINKTCCVIWDTLFLKRYIKALTSKRERKKIVNNF